jgi:alpha-glucosidase
LGLTVPGSKPNGIGVGDPQPDEALGLRRGRAATMLMLALPGSSYVYQGEELGLPEHTALDDDERQDPTWWRSDHTERGRDGCRVPLPWASGQPAFGFSPTGASWLTQPASFAAYALDTQVCVPGSTFEMYRTALRLRREFHLGSGSLAWVDGLGTDDPAILAFVNRDVLVVTNLGASSIHLDGDLELLLASADLPHGYAGENGFQVPTDVTVWLRRRS